MAIQKFTEDIEKYLKWATDSNGTTQQDYQEFVRNMYNLVGNLINVVRIWQPSTNYNNGDIVLSPSMVPNTLARVSTAGTSGISEPDWGASGASVSDGTAKYTIMPRTLDFATDTEAKEGTASGTIISPATLKSTLDIGLAKKVNIADYDADKSATATDIAKKLNIADLTPQKLWDVRHSLGTNYVPTDTTNAGWNALGLAISYYDTADKITNQPTRFGQLINIPATMNSIESMQMWVDQTNGAIYTRRGNGSVAVNDQTFKKLAFEDDAGVVAGDVSNANAWWVKLGGTIPLIIQGGMPTRWIQNATLTFPITFPHAVLSIIMPTNRGDNGSDHTQINSYTTSFVSTWGTGYTVLQPWIAIGY